MREDVTLYGGNVQLTFEPSRHIYTVSRLEDDKWTTPIWVPSVTGVTGMVDDGKANALMGWATNLMMAEVLEKAKGLWATDEDLNEVNLPSILKNAKYANRRAVESAATLGTVVHDYCENHIKAQLGLNDEPKRPRHKKAQFGIDGFLKWEDENKPEYIFSERKIYSISMHVAGTLDILARLNGELSIVDLKTSSRVYTEHKLQTAAYAQALNEEFEEQVTNRVILHLSREKATFTVHDLNREGKYNGVTFEDDLAGFKGARQIYKRLKETEKK